MDVIESKKRKDGSSDSFLESSKKTKRELRNNYPDCPDQQFSMVTNPRITGKTKCLVESMGFGYSIDYSITEFLDREFITDLIRFSEINRNSLYFALCRYNFIDYFKEHKKLPNLAEINNEKLRQYGTHPLERLVIDKTYKFLSRLDRTVRYAYKILDLEYDSNIETIQEKNIQLEKEFYSRSIKAQRKDINTKILQNAASHFLIERQYSMRLIITPYVTRPLIDSPMWTPMWTPLYIDSSCFNRLEESIKNFITQYQSSSIIEIKEPTDLLVNIIDTKPAVCETLADDIQLEKNNLDQLFIINTNIKDDNGIKIDSKTLHYITEESIKLFHHFRTNNCPTDGVSKTGRPVRVGTANNMIKQTILVDNINRFVVDVNTSIGMYCLGNNENITLRRPNIICLLFGFIIQRIKKIEERLDKVFSQETTTKTLQEYIKSIYVHDTNSVLNKTIPIGNTFVNLLYIFNNLNKYLYRKNDFDSQYFSFNCVDVELYNTTLEYLAQIEYICNKWIDGDHEFNRVFSEFRQHILPKDHEISIVRGDYLIEYIRLLYNLLSLIFIGQCRRILKYNKGNIVVEANPQKYITVDEDKNREFFALKRQGDWGQVVSAKKNGYVFITFDRLAFVYAILCNVPSILQRKEPNECIIHHYSYICFNPYKSGYSPRENRVKNRKIDCEYLFDGEYYSFIKASFIERLKLLNNSDIPVVTDLECKQILYLTMSILDTWHDWKEGRGSEKYDFEFKTILKCLNFDKRLLKYLNTMYLILGLGKVASINLDDGPPKSTFEGNVVNATIDQLKRYFNKGDSKIISIFDNRLFEKMKKDMAESGLNDLAAFSQLNGRFFNKDTITYLPEIQFFSHNIFDFYGRSKKYIIDATSNDSVFKYLNRVAGCEFLENFYSKYDGSSSRYKTRKDDDELYNFLYCGHTGIGNDIDFENDIFKKLSNMSINKIIKENSKKTTVKNECFATKQVDSSNLSINEIIKDKTKWKVSDNRFVHVIFGNRLSIFRNIFTDYNSDIIEIEKDIEKHYIWGISSKNYLQIISY